MQLEKMKFSEQGIFSMKVQFNAWNNSSEIFAEIFQTIEKCSKL